MIKTILILFLLFLSATSQAACVILLHGLARSESSMAKLEQRLTEKNFIVINQGYPSRKFPIEELAEKAISPALAKCPEDHQINFITHSLGGILVRQYLSHRKLPKLNRVVMLGPPNQGSEVVDKLKDIPGFHFINGDAGMQLGTGKLSVPNQLGAADFNLGIIAGTRSINWILSSLIPESDDGKVSVERTKLEGMNDHLQLPVSHPFLMKNEAVINQAIYYLQHGHFKKTEQQSN